MNTPQELIDYLNTTYGKEHKWPMVFEVSAELYGRVAQTIIDHRISIHDYTPMATYNIIEFVIGKNNGIMFKNVELRIKTAI